MFIDDTIGHTYALHYIPNTENAHVAVLSTFRHAHIMLGIIGCKKNQE